MSDEVPHDRSSPTTPTRETPIREDGLIASPLDGDLSMLADAYFDGRVSPQQMEALNSRLRSDEAARDLYLQLCDLHSCVSIDDGLWVGSPETAIERHRVDSRNTIEVVRGVRKGFVRTLSQLSIAIFVVAIPCATLLIGLRVNQTQRNQKEETQEHTLATIGEQKNCQLNGASKPLETGSSVISGQRIDLAAGTMQIKFASGALAMIHGPAVFDVNSRNSGFLTFGKVNVTACTSESTDFSLKTVSANAVHNCAEFSAEVATNGRTRFDVSKGSLQIHIPTMKRSQRLDSGGAIELDSSRDQIITLIESGDGTPAFRFLTIPPPSSRDFADQSRGIAVVRCFGGQLQHGSGPPEILLDGKGQSAEDAPMESLYFTENASGIIVLDLGRSISVSMINTYSWHRAAYRWHRTDACFDRAPQKFTLYGSSAIDMPSLAMPHIDAGWTLISHVNTDEFFQTQADELRPPQQASSIRASEGPVGSYRYLMWAVRPSIGYDKKSENNTYYGEIDVYGE